MMERLEGAGVLGGILEGAVTRKVNGADKEADKDSQGREEASDWHV